ncbi:MAG: copper chaperone PCu(A)C [Phyllobacteriaceae bacterium]|nr:copper chaperone PCu(A)C [Phyllobacteriaceae bacterium]
MKTLRTLALASGLALLTTGAALAHGYKLGALEIGHPWSRATPKSAPVGGGYLTITNTGTTADRLVAVSADVSQKVELHEMAVVDGVMKMRALDDGVVVPAGGKVELKPGGHHVMFIGLKAQFAAGTSFKGTLTFEKAGKVDVEFQVEDMAAKMPEHSGAMPMDHGAMKPMGQ